MNALPDVAPDVRLSHGQPLTTSLNIAEVFGKRHCDVLRSIERLECSVEFCERNFASASYLDGQGKSRPMVEITRDGFTFLAMGFTGKEAAKWKEAYIAAFNRLERERAEGAGLPRIGEGPLTLAQFEALQDRLLEAQAALLETPVLISAGDLALLGITSQRLAYHQRRAAGTAAAELIIRMEAEGRPRAEIIRASGRSAGMVRQVIFQARKEGRLPKAGGAQ